MDIVSPELLAMVEDLYELDGVRAIRSLAGGYWNTTILLNASNGSHALRIYYQTATPEGVSYEHMFMCYMSQHILQVPAPTTTRLGQTFFYHRDRIIALFPYMRGKIPDRHHQGVRVKSARMLSNIHQVGLGFPNGKQRPGYPPLLSLDWDANRMWTWSKVEALFSGDASAMTEATRHFRGGIPSSLGSLLDQQTLIREEREAFKRWINNLHASGRILLWGTIHGDFYPNNLLVKDGRISAVLDWEDCQREWLVWELSRALWEFCKNEDGYTMEHEWAMAFIAEYLNTGGPIPAAEFDLLIPLIRCIRLIEVLYALGDATRGERWYPEYALRNLNYLDVLRNYKLLS
jgi:Ser/Thr protein kinase RdoA (MazF antagonist)